MNFLAHLFLSGDMPEVMVGNLMGDFVKGRLGDEYPPGIMAGLKLHRGIDSFAQGSPLFMASKRRIDPSFGHYRGVLVDLFYDHFLALHWDEYSEEPWGAFIRRAERVAGEQRRYLPERLLAILPYLFGDWLPSYRRIEGIEAVLGRMAVRVGRGNPLARGGGELRRHCAELRGDFRLFMPELVAFTKEMRERLTGREEPGP